MILPGAKEDSAYLLRNSSLLQGLQDIDGDTLAVAQLQATHGSLAPIAEGCRRPAHRSRSRAGLPAPTSTALPSSSPSRQTGNGGQCEQAWTQAGYVLTHKADHTNAAEPWSAVKLNSTSSNQLAGGDIYAGDLGVSGQSLPSSSVRPTPPRWPSA